MPDLDLLPPPAAAAATADKPAGAALDIDNLTVRLYRHDAEIAAVNGVSFSLAPGETLTILGESGSGKSVTLKALMGLLPSRAKVGGTVRLAGQSILDLPTAALSRLRGRRISMVFQEPMSALDPVYTIGIQIAEAIVRHEGISRQAAMQRAQDMLERVRIPSAKRRLGNYPHEMSGGMRQRAMIALALACKPDVLLADEPTTALDVTVQIQILLLLRQLQEELGMAVVFVTHDMGVAAEISDRVAVMYAGRFMETGTARQIIRDPRHPYTAGLLSSTLHGGRRSGVGVLEAIPGAPPDLGALPPGCAFAPRCRLAEQICRDADPPVLPREGGGMVRCVRAVATAN
jgi:peptide/nickel transport system ATP-binding protein